MHLFIICHMTRTWDAAWNIENKVSARANIQYTFVNPAEKDANIVDINATAKEDWKVKFL